MKFKSNKWKCPSCGNKPLVSNGYYTFSPSLAKQNNMFCADAFKELSKVEAKNFWFRARNRLINWMLDYYFSKAKNFFEIGCGTGFVLSAIERNFPNFHCVGSEIYINALDFAKKRVKKASLIQMDARYIPFEDEFDVIGAFDVLEHIKEDEEVISQMYKALKPGGGLILTVPQHPFLWSYIDECSCHCRRYRAKDLIKKLQDAGFFVLRKTSFVSLLLPAMLCVRLCKRQEPKNFDPVAELKINKLMNFIFEKVMALERLLIRCKINLPIGGSLLIVAEKPK